MRHSDQIARAYEPAASLLALFGQTPESHADLLRRLDSELLRAFGPPKSRAERED